MNEVHNNGFINRIAAEQVRRSSSRNDSGTFGEILSGLIDSEEQTDPLLQNAPDKWTDEAGLSANSVKKAYEKLRELGIDPDKRKPHELTDEEISWLRSRHDFANMTQYTVEYIPVDGGVRTQPQIRSTAEYCNFLADLAYLGAYSYDDLVVPVSPLDTRPNGFSVLSGYAESILSGAGKASPLDNARLTRDYLNDMYDFYDNRSKNPLLAVAGDSEFAELIRTSYMPLYDDFLNLFTKIFDRNG